MNTITTARPPEETVWPVIYTAGSAGIQTLLGAPGVGQCYYLTGMTVLNGASGGDFNILRRNAPTFNSATDTLTITDNAALEPGTNDFALSFWIKFTAYSTKTNAALLDKFDANNGYLVSVASTGKLSLKIGDGTDTVTVTSDTDICDGKWHHVFASCDRDSETGFNLYIDGNLHDSQDPTAVGSITGGTQDLVATGTAAQTFLLSSLALYVAGIPDYTDLYSNGAGRKIEDDETYLVFALNLDEGTGTTCYDLKTTNNGTLLNTVWADDGAPVVPGYAGLVGPFQSDVETGTTWFPQAIPIAPNTPFTILNATGTFKVVFFGYKDYSGTPKI
jgi:hypothetical protein